MNREGIVVLSISLLLGIALLGVGILIGHSFPPRVLIVDSSGVAPANSVEAQIGNRVTIQGVGSVKVKPEVAHLDLGIEICDVSANKANQEVNARLARLAERMQALGVPQDNIVPVDFSLYPYSTERGVTFCALNEVMVTTDHIEAERIGELLDQAIEAGVNKVHGVTFTVKDKTRAREEAIRLAYQHAQAQMEQLAKLLGESPVKVVEVNVTVNDELSGYLTGYHGGGGMVAPKEGEVKATVVLVCIFQ